MKFTLTDMPKLSKEEYLAKCAEMRKSIFILSELKRKYGKPQEGKI